MRSLAEYVMRGRTEAAMVSVLATGTMLFAWVGAAVVALVTLRHGSRQSSQVLLWAMLPAIVVAAMGDTGPVTTLLGVTLAAGVLRTTTSWSWALIAAVVSGFVTAAVMLSFGRGYIDELLRMLTAIQEQMIATQQHEQASASPLLGLKPTVLQVAGLLGLSNAFTVAMCLILARWWQALLYNPGGFSQEFHQLRLAPPLTVLLLVLGLGLSSLGADFRLWSAIVAIPFLFAGLALVHGVVAKRQGGSHWLVLFYLGWLLFDPLKMLLLVVAIADSWLDIRRRLPSRSNTGSAD